MLSQGFASAAGPLSVVRRLEDFEAWRLGGSWSFGLLSCSWSALGAFRGTPGTSQSSLGCSWGLLVSVGVLLNCFRGSWSIYWWSWGLLKFASGAFGVLLGPLVVLLDALGVP